MKKRILGLSLSLCMLLTMLLGTMVFAAETPMLVISKTQFRLQDKGTVTVKGLTEQAIEDGAYIGIVKEGTKTTNTYADVYVSDLPETNSYEFTAPSEFGKYEIRLMDADNNLITKVLFSVIPGVAELHHLKLSIDKARLGDNMSLTISGLTEAEIALDVYISLVKSGTKIENSYADKYVSDISENNTWEFTAPTEFGKYEIRILYPDGKTMFGKVEFEVAPAKAALEDISITKLEAKSREKIAATIKGLTKAEIREGVFLGVVPVGTKMENTYADIYVSDLLANNIWEFEAPSEYGLYEIRVVYPDNKTLFGVKEFAVISSKAKQGDLTLTPTDAAPGEKMKFTVKGLTEGEVGEGAWIGLVREGTKLENTYADVYISDLPVGNTWEFNAPSEAGKYELRVFCKSSLTPEQMEYGMFGKVTFTVSGPPAVVIYEGYENVSGWAVTEINEAAKNELVTDKVMVEFKKDLTREEFCELVIKLYERMTGKTAEPAATNPFKDTKNPEILKAFNLGIVNGVDMEKGIFAPDAPVNREQIAAMIVRALKKIMPELDTTKAEFTENFHDKNEVSTWAYDSLKFLNNNGIFKGASGYILPKANTTREQGIALVKRVFDKFFDI